MSTINLIDSSFSNKDISSVLSVYEYTANKTCKVRLQVQLTSLAGDGDYTVYLTLNDGDAVADNVIWPKTTVTLAAGAQSIWFTSGDIDVMNGDVINVFALGQAGDTAVAGIIRIFSDDMTGCELADGAISAAKIASNAISNIKIADSAITAGKIASNAIIASKIGDGTITSAKIATDAITATKIATDAIGASELAAGAVTKIQNGLALEATLTAIKGAGWSDETLVAIKAVVDAIDVSGVADAVLDELLAGHTDAGSLGKAIADVLVDTDTTIPALIAALSAWQATNVTSAVSSGSITDIRGNDWDIDIEDLTLDSNKQQFAIKRYKSNADSAALLLIDSDTGLLYLNGAAGTAGDASLSYAGTTLTVTVKASATAQLPTGTFYYGIQGVTAGGVVAENYGGDFVITEDVVRATS